MLQEARDDMKDTDGMHLRPRGQLPLRCLNSSHASDRQQIVRDNPLTLLTLRMPVMRSFGKIDKINYIS